MSTTSVTSASGATGPPATAVPLDAELTVVARRHPWRWVGVGVVLVLLAMFLHGLVTNPGWDWPTFLQFFATRTIFSALWVTVQLTVYGTVLGFVLGAVLASMRLLVAAWEPSGGTRSPRRPVRRPAAGSGGCDAEGLRRCSGVSARRPWT